MTEAAHQIEDALARIRLGDPSAFETIMRQHQAMVFSIAYHFLRDRAVGEEMAQDVFLQLYQNLDSIKSASHLTFWLRKVTSHRCLDQKRRQKLRSHLSLDEVPEPAFHDNEVDTMLAGTLRGMVALLPEAPRMVMILRFQEDLLPFEIADVLDMPVNTVKSHLRRSLESLRDKLGRKIGKYEYE